MTTQASLFRPRFLFLLALQFVFGLGFSSFFLLPKYLTEVHGAGPDLIGRVMAAGPIAAVATIPFAASFIDRIARRAMLAAGALALFVAALGFRHLGELGLEIYFLRALQGAGFTLYMSAGATLVAELSPPERLGQAFGLLGAAMLSTNAIGPGLAEPIAQRYGWHPVFVASAACSLIALLGVYLLREERRVVSPRLVSVRLWQPRLRRLLYAGAVVGVSFGTVITFYQPLALSLGIHEVRDLFIGYTITALAVRVVFGGWLDRFGRQRVALISASLYALAVLATAGLQPGWLLPLGLLLGLAHGMLYPVLSALVLEGADPNSRGTLMTCFGGSFNVGMTLSTLGCGLIAHAVGYRALFVIAGLFAASSVAAIAGITQRIQGEETYT
ncbi:MAG TPA: MFS transporter [Polyangiaceae bacterium]|nr:MFS transporter [Polyangiaceae bacterium]